MAGVLLASLDISPFSGSSIFRNPGAPPNHRPPGDPVRPEPLDLVSGPLQPPAAAAALALKVPRGESRVASLRSPSRGPGTYVELGPRELGHSGILATKHRPRRASHGLAQRGSKTHSLHAGPYLAYVDSKVFEKCTSLRAPCHALVKKLKCHM